MNMQSWESHGAVCELHDLVPVIQSNSRALASILNWLEACESTWPCRKSVSVSAAGCRTWRLMCKRIVSKMQSFVEGSVCMLPEAVAAPNNAWDVKMQQSEGRLRLTLDSG